ncbi:DciA family protein [Streptomyces sp. NPDC001288]
MTDPQTPSGADLARQALARARAAAKTAPPARQRTPRRARREMGAGRDPRPLGGIITNLSTEEGWADSLGAGNITDRWTDLCPTVYAHQTRPVGYDPDTGTLTISAASHTVAAGLRLAQLSLAKTINDKLGRTVVRQLRVRVGGDPAGARTLEDQAASDIPAMEAPVRTRETASPGYRTALELATAHRPDPAPTDPLMAAAIARQEAALRANRQPEPAEPLDQVPARQIDRSEMVRRAAIVRKRNDQAGRTQPRRAFDVA